MRPEEFRLGIWVCWEGRDIVVEEGCLEVLFGARNYKDYKPIPLTEEWLLKFGFNKDLIGWDLIGWDKGDFDLRQYGNESGYRDYGLQFSGLGIEIIYVHQLQNLYFALTGEELTTLTQ